MHVRCVVIVAMSPRLLGWWFVPAGKGKEDKTRQEIRELWIGLHRRVHGTDASIMWASSDVITE